MPNIDPHQINELVQKYKQWNIGANHAGDVLTKAHFADHPDRSYSLKNKVAGNFLQYEEQELGINLGWTDDATEATEKRVSRWFFTRREGTGGPVRYAETIALANGTGRSFLRNAPRPFGINLDWSNAPIFEWQVLGGHAGSVVKRNTPVAIFNTSVREFFTYFNRNVGGHIGWSDSERWEHTLSEKLKALVREYGYEAVKAAVLVAMSP